MLQGPLGTKRARISKEPMQHSEHVSIMIAQLQCTMREMMKHMRHLERDNAELKRRLDLCTSPRLNKQVPSYIA